MLLNLNLRYFPKKCNDFFINKYLDRNSLSFLSILNFYCTKSASECQTKFTLKNKIIQKINFTGPITIYDYMKIVLTAPDNGFYMKQDVFGSKGHFTTSPEISQIFGELIGVWILNEWNRFSQPKPLRIVEFGPGRGTLMNDILRVFSQFIKVKNYVSIFMIEISPFLRETQEKNLCHRKSTTNSNLTKNNFSITWKSNLDSIDERDGFTVYLAHEFLDALPIHKFKLNKEKNWREVLIDYAENLGEKKFKYIISNNETYASKLYIPPNINGEDFEFSPDCFLLIDKISKRLNNYPGLMLCADYGYSQKLSKNQPVKRDTFRAFKNHTLCDPLKYPGLADLTADVDFDFLKSIVESNSTCFGPVNQDYFLNCLGIQIRLKKLLQNVKNEIEKENLKSGVKMITKEMGKRFKFFTFYSKQSENLFKNNPPAGFL